LQVKADRAAVFGRALIGARLHPGRCDDDHDRQIEIERHDHSAIARRGLRTTRYVDRRNQSMLT